jgi:hypothetical protein
MIGASIVALSLLVNGAPSTRTVLDASAAPAVSVPSIKLPRISMPKWRLPHFPKHERAADPLAQTARRLSTLVSEQEGWYASHGTYSTNASKVAANSTRADSTLDKVQIQVLYASKKGWTAIASHPDAPGKNCVVYVGYRNSLPLVPRTRADAADAEREGKPTCDR